MNRRLALLGLTSAAATPLLAGTVRAASVSTDNGYINQTLQNGGFALAISQIALSKSKSPAVKTFADFEVIEQTAVGEALTNSTVPPAFTPTKTQAATIAKLNADTGNFDYNYLSVSLTGHYTLLRIQEMFLASGATPEDNLTHIALLARSNIRQHIILLTDLIQLHAL